MPKMEGIAWDLIPICFDALMRSLRSSLPSKVFIDGLIFLHHTAALSEAALQDADVLVAVSRAP